MRLRYGVLSSDKVDAHGDVMDVGVLQQMAKDIQKYWVPVGVEHDPRIPPLGRIREASLRSEPDGSTSLVGTIEEFEPGDVIPYQPSERRLRIEAPGPGIHISYDRGFQDPESQCTLRELEVLLKTPLKQDLKKAIEPITILTIAAAAFFTQFTGGFFKEMGADAYRSLKAKIKALFHVRASSASDRLLVCRFTVTAPETIFQFEVVLSNPTTENLEAFFDHGLVQVEEFIASAAPVLPSISRIVCAYESGRLVLLYSVRQDAVAVLPR